MSGKYVEFTNSMRNDYTILAPDIFPLHLDLVREVFAKEGYNLEIVRSQGLEVMERGLESVHNDMCYPLICTAGQLIHALESGKYDKNRTALLQFQTGGGCRASNYIWLLRKALENRGLGHVPVISLSFNNIERHSGFNLTPSIMVRGLICLLYGDMLTLLSNQVRPYEKNPGHVDRLVKAWKEKLSSLFRGDVSTRRLLASLKRNLKAIVADFSAIDVEKSRKVKVGVIGEIYVKYSPFANNNLESFLAGQGCEIMIPGVFPFVEYCFYNRIRDHKLYGTHSRFSMCLSQVLLRACRHLERMFLDALKGSRFISPSPFLELVDNAKKVFSTSVEMGEGWLLPAEAVELAKRGFNHIISAQPFGCLPNHIVAKGFARRFRQLYPSASLFPIDYDPSQSEANQENRIRLMLSVAVDNLSRSIS